MKSEHSCIYLPLANSKISTKIRENNAMVHCLTKFLSDNCISSFIIWPLPGYSKGLFAWTTFSEFTFSVFEFSCGLLFLCDELCKSFFTLFLCFIINVIGCTLTIHNKAISAMPAICGQLLDIAFTTSPFSPRWGWYRRSPIARLCQYEYVQEYPYLPHRFWKGS